MQKNRVCIIGCGNPFMGNDGAGISVMRLFEGRFPGVEAIDGGTGGFGLIPLMEGYERVVIVDAMTGIGDRTGEVLTFEVPPSWDLPAYALHDIGIGEVVTIARELGYAGEIVTVGIEVGEIQAFSRDIDPAVEEGIRVAEQKILTILREWIGDQGMRS
ncbi:MULTISPECIES: hydrogenase maturation protease [Methanoculleus]|uniref:Hydrogenase maturation protease n=2 Tax=Methanoculleus TaxID=45989 RepID=A3CU97_METMJ|nr:MULTISPECIES: hydrogenase maturation protease [Methanoculleus]ABN56947.1 hydrogenase maturation protease [Methanoculleus marisnigri JR1]MCC7555911.1 hydrogenase maturation protease [Methanoculleus marisnigri]UYU18370.1 hydrogenase maturation protease [Methanoculleus submarinus]